MGMDPISLGMLALSAAGAGAGAYNTYSTAKKQDRATAAGIRQQQMRQREADARVMQEIGARERSSPEAAREAALSDFLQTLRANRASAGGPAGAVGGNRFQTDTAGAEAGIQNFGEQVANTLSRIVAPQRQRQDEAVSQGRTASDLGTIGRMASGDDFLAQLRVNSIQRNPWIDAAGQIASGAAGAYAGSRAPYGQGTMDRLRGGPRDPRAASPFGGPVPRIEIPNLPPVRI